METKDILIYESGDGGEMAIINKDLALAETLYQQVYLALFGGNVEQNTTNNSLITEQNFDWWGNSLILEESPSEQFNSNTERTLNTTALNSAGRLTIIRAVESDLEYLSSLLNYFVDVDFPQRDKVRISVYFTPKDNQQDRVLVMVYDNAKNEVIIEKTI